MSNGEPRNRHTSDKGHPEVTHSWPLAVSLTLKLTQAYSHVTGRRRVALLVCAFKVLASGRSGKGRHVEPTAIAVQPADGCGVSGDMADAVFPPKLQCTNRSGSDSGYPREERRRTENPVSNGPRQRRRSFYSRQSCDL